MDAVTVHTADLQGLDGFSVQDEGQRLGHLSIGMRGDGNLELQRRRRGDLDFELCAHISPHSADDTSVSDQDHGVLNGPAW